MFAASLLSPEKDRMNLTRRYGTKQYECLHRFIDGWRLELNKRHGIEKTNALHSISKEPNQNMAEAMVSMSCSCWRLKVFDREVVNSEEAPLIYSFILIQIWKEDIKFRKKQRLRLSCRRDLFKSWWRRGYRVHLLYLSPVIVVRI